MTLALMGMLPEELAGLRQALEGAQQQHHAGREFHTGRLDGHQVVLVLSRLGNVAAATTATLLIERYGAEAIVFTGVAGGLAGSTRVGDVVVARELLQHDLDLSPLYPRHEVPSTGRARFPTDAPLSDALAAAARAALAAERIGLAVSLDALGVNAPALHEGLLVSGDRYVASAIDGLALRAELPDALAVDLAGAAVAQVCHDCDLPFAVLRTLAYRADDGAPADARRFGAEIAGPLAVAIVRRWLRDGPPLGG